MHTCHSNQVKADTVELDAKMCSVSLTGKITEVQASITAAISSALGTKVKPPTFQGETRQSGRCAIAFDRFATRQI